MIALRDNDLLYMSQLMSIKYCAYGDHYCIYSRNSIDLTDRKINKQVGTTTQPIRDV
jgi:hypothetical protein